jgi:prevent-host-death family protein
MIEVGAFEAKTNLSRLLDEVAKGAVVRITRRGKLVAILRAAEGTSTEQAVEALRGLGELCPCKVPLEEALAYRDKGRER